MSSMVRAAAPTARRRWQAVERGARCAPGAARRSTQEGEQCVLLAPLELEARGHGVAAAFDEKTLMHRISRPTAPRSTEAIERAEPVALTVGLERDDEGRPVKTLGDATGDQVRARPLCQPSAPRKSIGRAGVGSERSFGEGKGFLEHALLDRLTLGVERFELGGDGARLDLVVGGEQLGAEARRADPAAGIDARAEDEAERVAGRRRVDAGDVGERAQAGIVPEPQAP